MEWESDSLCCSHAYPRWCSGWDLELRNCGAVPGGGLLLTAERQIRGMWGRRLWWEMPVEESRAGMKAKRYCWIMHRGWSHRYNLSLLTASIGRWTTERLARQTPDALNYRVGPHPGCPFKCLMRPSMEKDPSQGTPLCAWRAEQQRRTPGEGAL